MRNNYYFSTCKPLVWVGLLFMSLLGYAQTKTYPSTATTTSITGVTNATLASGSDFTNFAQLNSFLLANDRLVNMNWAANVAASTPVYIKVTTDTTLLQGLLGGALGNLVGNLAQLLVDGQFVTVGAYTNTGTFVNSVTLNNTFSNDASTVAKVLYDPVGDLYIKFIPNGTFRTIRVTNTRTGTDGLTTSKAVNVYGAYTLTGVPSCTAPQFTSYTGNSLVSADLSSGTINRFGYRAIDNDPATYSYLTAGTASVAGYAEQQFYWEGANAAGSTFNVRLGLPDEALAAGLFNSISIIAYSGDTPVYTVTGASLLTVDVLGLLNARRLVTVSITPPASVTQTITKLGVRVAGLASVNVLSTELHIHSVTRGNFDIVATGAGTYVTGATVNLNANATGCSTYTYSWTNSAGTQVSTTAGYQFTAGTPGTYVYYVTATDLLGQTKTVAVTVTVLAPPPAVGTISGGGIICYGDLPGNVTVAGYTGNIVRWETSTNSGFTSPVTIASTSPTLLGSQIGNLIQNTYVRAVIGQTGYPTTFAYSTVLFNVNSSTWSGTAWSNGIPDLDTMIFINGNYTTNANLNGCAMQVDNNAVVSIPTGNTVTLKGSIRVLSGSVTFANNTHLIQLTDATNQGNVTFKRNSSSLFRLDYTLWSAPVSGQLLQSFSPNTATDRFYEYKFGTNSQGQPFEGYYHVDAATVSFTPGKSILIRMPTLDPTPGYNGGTTQMVFEGNFTGVPTNGVVLRPLSTENLRFTAVGNPYPSPINVQSFIDINEPVLADGSALYFWRKKNNTNATSYATLTRDTYVSNPATGGAPTDNQYGGQIWDDFFHNQVLPANWVINPGQGFIVKTDAALSSATLMFNNSMRRNVHNNQFFRSANPGTEDATSQYFLDIKSDVDATRVAMVCSNTATVGLDKLRDAEKLEDVGIISLYTLAENKKLVVQARPFAETDVIPLGYNAPAAKEYTISMPTSTGIFAEGQKVYLRDNVEGITRNITSEEYTFSTEAGVFNDRFELIYTTTVLDTENPSVLASEVIVYKKNNVINIDAGSTLINGVTIYDIRGSRIYNQGGINAVKTAVDQLNAQQQVLIIEVNTVKGTVSKKVVF